MTDIQPTRIRMRSWLFAPGDSEKKMTKAVGGAADVVIPINLPEGRNIFRATSTRYASLAVVDIIANLVAYQDRAKSTRILRGIKEQLVKQRDGGDDSQILGD